MDHRQIVHTLLEHRGRITGYAMAMLGSNHSTDNVFQNLCLRAMAPQQQFDSPEHLIHWAMQVTRNLAIDPARRSNRTTPLTLRAPIALAWVVLLGLLLALPRPAGAAVDQVAIRNRIAKLQGEIAAYQARAADAQRRINAAIAEAKVIKPRLEAAVDVRDRRRVTLNEARQAQAVIVRHFADRIERMPTVVAAQRQVDAAEAELARVEQDLSAQLEADRSYQTAVGLRDAAQRRLEAARADNVGDAATLAARQLAEAGSYVAQYRTVWLQQHAPYRAAADALAAARDELSTARAAGERSESGHPDLVSAAKHVSAANDAYIEADKKMLIERSAMNQAESVHRTSTRDLNSAQNAIAARQDDIADLTARLSGG